VPQQGKNADNAEKAFVVILQKIRVIPRSILKMSGGWIIYLEGNIE
jgi:hypothetical protein